MTDKTVLIRVNIAGYSGHPVSLYCAFDRASEMLLVHAAKEYDGGDAAGILKVTNQERDTHRDDLLTDEHLQDAIRAYFEMDGLKLLHLDEKPRAHNPANRIERDGVSESGVRYRLSPEITCGQVAVMYACLAASRQRGVSSALDFMTKVLSFTV